MSQELLKRSKRAPSWHRFHRCGGFTLIELVIVIVITGILVTTMIAGIGKVGDGLRFEQARKELDELAIAITGNSALQMNGVRQDFGYVGDIGALPPNLDALVVNPGSYATWRGPYVPERFLQAPADFKTDPWGQEYVLTPTSVISDGSGSAITRTFATSLDNLLYNRLEGNIVDLTGTPPGQVFAESLLIILQQPDGAGGIMSRLSTPDRGGFFVFDSVPVGQHSVEVIYTPDADTLERMAVVLPGGVSYLTDFLSGDRWYDTVAVGTPLAHYTFDELSGLTTHDITGNGNDLTLTDMDAFSREHGPVGSSAYFDGVDDVARSPVSVSQLQLTGDYSVSLWVRAEPLQVAWAGLYARTNAAALTRHWTLQFDDTPARSLIVCHGNGVAQRWETGLMLVDIASSWHHFVVVRSGTVMRMYLDGQSVSTGSFAQDPGNGTGQLHVGAAQSGADRFTLAGSLDDLRIFNYALTDYDIARLYGAGG
jgi:prepilin-type N-terminal cleavage/methylation domain-containing protein